MSNDNNDLSEKIVTIGVAIWTVQQMFFNGDNHTEEDKND